MKININAKILIVLSIILLVAFAGCTSTTKTEQTVQSPGGDVKVVEGSGPDWCKAGSSMTSEQSTQGQYSYVIKGMTTYKGQEVCEAEATVTGTGQQGYSMTYYFSKDSKFAHIIMKDASGKVINDMDVTQPTK